MLTIMYSYLYLTFNRSEGEIDGQPLFETLNLLSNFQRNSSNELMDIRK